MPARAQGAHPSGGDRILPRLRFCAGGGRGASDISWFMKLLCQHIAPRANRMDRVRGKFWESRFGAVPLLDEEALLACSVYVDPNPIRAGKADTPEASEYASAYQRIQALRQWEQRHAGTPPADLAAALPLDRESEVEADLWLAPIALTGDSARPATLQANPFPARRASDRGFLPLALTTIFGAGRRKGCRRFSWWCA